MAHDDDQIGEESRRLISKYNDESVYGLWQYLTGWVAGRLGKSKAELTEVVHNSFPHDETDEMFPWQ